VKLKQIECLVLKKRDPSASIAKDDFQSSPDVQQADQLCDRDVDLRDFSGETGCIIEINRTLILPQSACRVVGIKVSPIYGRQSISVSERFDLGSFCEGPFVECCAVETASGSECSK